MILIECTCCYQQWRVLAHLGELIVSCLRCGERTRVCSIPDVCATSDWVRIACPHGDAVRK